MRLTFVHGRSQQGKSELQIKTYWTGGLNNGYVLAGFAEFPDAPTYAPFYGDKLIEIMKAATGATTRGAGDEVDPLARAIALQLAVRSGTNTSAAVESEFVERGPDEWGWVQAVLRAVSERAPGFTETVLNQLVEDVMAYLKREAVRDAVHEVVRPHLLSSEPTVVVAHSLGSVVAYALLAELGTTARVPLFVTAGSPLGLPEIKNTLERFSGGPVARPEGVDKWLNVTDERDIVALYASLDEETFAPGIQNLTDINNPIAPHDIAGYLTDKRVAGRIGAALSPNP